MEALWQVVVQWNGKPVPVGPRVKQSVAEEFAAAIRSQIAIGREKQWSDPQVIPALKH